LDTAKFGDRLNQIAHSSTSSILRHNQVAQLTWSAYHAAVSAMPSDGSAVQVQYPIGWKDDKPTLHTAQYSQQYLRERYRMLATIQLPTDLLTQMVTTVETMLLDVIRAVVIEFPKKLNKEKKIELSFVLSAKSIEEVHTRAADALINELSYLSPKDFAKSFNDYVGVDLMDCAAFQRYQEIKATRDVYMHNGGFANQTYLKKSGSHARARDLEKVPIDLVYFFKSSEECLSLSEWLEEQLHEIWRSDEYVARLARLRDEGNESPDQSSVPRDETSEELLKLAAKVHQDGSLTK
jgi:hypothetical protein